MKNLLLLTYFLFLFSSIKAFSQETTENKETNLLPFPVVTGSDTIVQNLNKVEFPQLSSIEASEKQIERLTLIVGVKQQAEVNKLKKIGASFKSEEDSIVKKLTKIPAGYIRQVNRKIEKYSEELNHKTERALARLSKWENRIQRILTKVNPESATKLFGNNQETFGSLLKKIKEGQAITQNYKAKYDKYREELSSQLKYIESKRDKLNSIVAGPVIDASNKIDHLDTDIKKSEAVEEFIKERKNQLIDEAIKYMGKSKYLIKINKETYYYAESLRNCKEIFSEPKKAEALAIKILNNVPAFKKFADQNSSLTGLFASSRPFSNSPVGQSSPVINGLPSRGSLQQFLKSNIPSLATTNLVQQIQGKIQDMPSELDKLKNAVNDMGKTKNNALPEFKPNSQKSKPFKKRLEYGTDLQFGKSVDFLPATSDLGIKMGYKLNDKSVLGIGFAYKIGLGHGWDNIKISSQGLAYRTYLKWKLRKGLDIQGGSEWNYMLQFNKLKELKNNKGWEQSALLGLCKSYKMNKRVKGNIQALYDFLYNKHLPNTQPLIIRFGYGF